MLKKIDKREHAWWIIPCLSILLSIGVFFTGAKDKIKNPQFNEMGIYQYNDNYLSGYQATTLLSNKSGDFTLTYDKNAYTPIPYLGYGELQVKAITSEKIKKNGFKIENIDSFEKMADTWIRRKIAMINDSNVLGKYTTSDITKRARETGVSITTKKSRIVLPNDKKQIKVILGFLDEEAYKGPFSQNTYLANSKRKVNGR